MNFLSGVIDLGWNPLAQGPPIAHSFLKTIPNSWDLVHGLGA